jgi:hypothetical protein
LPFVRIRRHNNGYVEKLEKYKSRNIMENLAFILRDWKRSYGELSRSDEETLEYYECLEKKTVPRKELKEHLVSLEIWARYAYDCNVKFRKRIQNKELNPDKEFDRFQELYEKEGRNLYVTALIEENNQPYASIHFSGMFVVISYIDEYNRVYMEYSFRTEYGKQDLFLYELEYYIYPKKAKCFEVDNEEYVSYYFTPKGELSVTKEFNIGTAEHTREIYEAENLVNVGKNWEPYPEFGQWDNIVRMERWEMGDYPQAK